MSRPLPNIDRIVLDITQPSMNPRYRPDDITWTLTGERTEAFAQIVRDLLEQTTINDQVTLAALARMAADGDEAGVEQVMAAGVDPGTGGVCRDLSLYADGERLLSFSVEAHALSSHYYEVFMPLLTEKGDRSVTSRSRPLEKPDRPITRPVAEPEISYHDPFIYRNPPPPRLGGEEE